MESPVKIAAIFVQLICIIKSQKYLSHDGTSSQSTTYVWGDHGHLFAKLAVTGGPTNDFDSVSCSHTAEKQNIAWWMLAFPGKTIYFTNVKIFYRSNFQKRLAGYSLYVTNSSVTGTSPKPTNGHLCFHHTGTTLPSINQTVDCNVLGQYIVIYNERNSTVNDKHHGYSEHAWLELCDVQIYGCHKTWFGEDCNQRCSIKCTDQHCYPGNGSCVWGCNCLRDNCDNSTICTGGCNRGYAGQYCNQYNLASFGTATQQSTQGDPDLAIDSDRTAGSCSKPSGQEAWWQVDLGQLSVIKNIYIYISAVFSGGSNGPYVYATNTSGSRTDGMLLTMTIDLNNSLPILSHYADPYIMGRYVIYVPGSVNVDLCEVEVVGCPVGRFGQDCNQTCPENCHGSCQLETGRCIYGCNNGWLNQYCNQSCTAGTFGSQCLEDCHCRNVSFPCNHVHGTCPEGGCQRGYKGSSCNIECSVGTYGYNCEDSCDGCLLDRCDKRNGACTNQSGCKPGWQSKLRKCDLACDDGYFGMNCAYQCYCRYGACIKATGICPTKGCQRGFKGDTCSEECSVGTYGYNCEDSCEGCLLDTCDNRNGTCTDQSGCKPGWQPKLRMCDLACDDGYFGMNCAHQCYCRYGDCIKATGICPTKGCQRGWKGDTCSEECSDGDHGFDCVEHCNTCHSTLCERFEGNCTYGCIEGFKGYQCLVSATCTPQSDEQSTTDHTLNIIYAVIGTFIANTFVCIIIFLAIFRYRRGKADGDTNRQNTSGYINNAFTNDYANIGNKNVESHYEDTIPSTQEQNYDTI